MALPPGFRFHPTDAELVGYYLMKKVKGHPIEFDVVADVDLYKCEPWDLPDKSRIPSKDLEWFFFSPRDKKYPNGSRTNRATERGYWKATGRDRNVKSKARTIGMKKTLVYYTGRAPNGTRTDWLMHEYRLEGDQWDESNFSQDGYVLCRVFKKSALDIVLNSKATGAHSKIAPAPLHGEVPNSVFAEFDVKPKIGALPVALLPAEPLSESQVVEDGDPSEGLTTEYLIEDSLPQEGDSMEKPSLPMAVSHAENVPPASSVFDSGWMDKFDDTLKNPLMQGRELDFLPPIYDPDIGDLLDEWCGMSPLEVLPPLAPDSPGSLLGPEFEVSVLGQEYDPLFCTEPEDSSTGKGFPLTGIDIRTRDAPRIPSKPLSEGVAIQRVRITKTSASVSSTAGRKQHDLRHVQTPSTDTSFQVIDDVGDDGKDSKTSDTATITLISSKCDEEVESGESSLLSEEKDDATSREQKLWAEAMIKSPSADSLAKFESKVENAPEVARADQKTWKMCDDSLKTPFKAVGEQSDKSLSEISEPVHIERGISTPATGMVNFALSISLQPTVAALLTSPSKHHPLGLENVVGSPSGIVSIHLVLLTDPQSPIGTPGKRNLFVNDLGINYETKSVGERFVQNLLATPNLDVSPKSRKQTTKMLGKDFLSLAMRFLCILFLPLPQLSRLVYDAQTGSTPMPL